MLMFELMVFVVVISGMWETLYRKFKTWDFLTWVTNITIINELCTLCWSKNVKLNMFPLYKKIYDIILFLFPQLL